MYRLLTRTSLNKVYQDLADKTSRSSGWFCLAILRLFQTKGWFCFNKTLKELNIMATKNHEIIKIRNGIALIV